MAVCYIFQINFILEHVSLSLKTHYITLPGLAMEFNTLLCEGNMCLHIYFLCKEAVPLTTMMFSWSWALRLVFWEGNDMNAMLRTHWPATPLLSDSKTCKAYFQYVNALLGKACVTHGCSLWLRVSEKSVFRTFKKKFTAQMLCEIKRHNIHLQAKYRCNQCFHFWIHSEEKETFVLEQLWSVTVLKKKKRKPH